jgi:hypothetical protein
MLCGMAGWVPIRTYRPGLVVRLFVAVFFFASALIAAVAGADPEGGGGTAPTVVGGLVLALGGVVAGIAILRRRLTVCREGLIVCHWGFLTTRIPWDEVRGFELADISSESSDGHCVGIRLTNGRNLKAMGTGGTIQQASDTLAELNRYRSQALTDGGTAWPQPA